MKKILTVREFREYCGAHKPSSVLFSSENQNSYAAAGACKLSLSFPKISVLENPNIIYLQSQEGALWLSRVKSVEVDPDSSVLGTVFTVLCAGFPFCKGDIAYTLIAS